MSAVPRYLITFCCTFSMKCFMSRYTSSMVSYSLIHTSSFFGVLLKLRLLKSLAIQVERYVVFDELQYFVVHENEGTDADNDEPFC